MTFAPDNATKATDVSPRLNAAHLERRTFLDTNNRNYGTDPGSVNNGDLAGTHCSITNFELDSGISRLNSPITISKYTVNIRGSRDGASTLDCFSIPPSQFAVQVTHDNNDLTNLPPNPLSLTSGSNVMTITYSSPHGLSVNSDVRLAGLGSALGGVDPAQINRLHRVATVPSSTTVTVILQVNASATVASGGGTGLTSLSNLNGNDTIGITFSLSSTSNLTNPLSVTNASNQMVITYPSAHGLAVGASVTVQNASTFAGLSSGDLNRTFTVDAVLTTTTIRVLLPTTANATLSSQGGSVTVLNNVAPLSVTNGSNVMTITYLSAHSLRVNTDILIKNATAFGGLTSNQINRYHRIVSVPSTTTVTVALPANATSTVTGGGNTIIATGNFIERFRHYQTNYSIDSVRLMGSGRTGSHGVLLGNTLKPAGGIGDNRSTRGEMLRNTEIHGFNIGVQEGPHDSYLQHSENVVISGCAIGLSATNVPEPGGSSNRGERMMYDNWTIYDTSDYMIHSDSRGIVRKFDGVSLDFSEKGFLYHSVNAGYGEHSFDRAWWESCDETPVRSDAPSDSVNHLVTSLRDVYLLQRRTTQQVFNGVTTTQLSHTGGAWSPIAEGYQCVRVGSLRITDEQRFTDPAGLFMFTDEVRVDIGAMNIMFAAFNSGFTQRLVSESVIAVDNYNFSASDSSLVAWTTSSLNFLDITLQSPAGVTLGTNPLAVTSGSPIMTITYPSAHGLRPLDEVIISGVSSAIGGVPITSINRKHRVVSVPSSNTIIVKLNFFATGNASGGTGCTAKEANFLRLEGTGSSRTDCSGLLTSDIFYVEPGQMWNANFKVRTAVGSVGTDRLDLRFRWLSANDREIGFSQTSEARLGGVTGGRDDGFQIGLYSYTDVPDYVANNRSRPVMGLGCYRRVPAGAFKAQLQLVPNSINTGDVIDIALIGANRMS